MSQHLASDARDGDFTSFHRVLRRDLYKGGPTNAEDRELDRETEE
jgi:hypothetical protein